MISQAPPPENERDLLPSEYIRRAIERLAFQANRTAKSPRPDAVHDLRVAIRRAEQALVTFRDHVPRKSLRRIRKQLKAVLSCAGALRDCDVAAKILAKIRQPGAAALGRRIQVSRKHAEKELLTRLRHLSLRTRVSRWCDDLKLNALQAEFDADALRALGKETLSRLAQRFFQAGETAFTQSTGERLHDFRIRAKKFRYAIELFLPVYGPPADEWTREIKTVQAILGSMNDYRTVLAMAAGAGCGNKLKSALRRSERRKIRQFRAVWEERFSGSGPAWLQALRLRAPEDGIRRKPITAAVRETHRAAAAGE